jgi:O-antigen ligase
VSVRQILVKLAIAGAAVLGSLAILQVSAVRIRLVRAIVSPTGPFYTRGHVWSASLRMLRDHPVFGAGLGGYQTVMAPYRSTDPYNVPEPYAHNMFLSTWSELGLLGLVAFVWILGALIIQPWRAIGRAAGVQVPLLWGTGAAFAMLVAHGIVDTPYWKNDLSAEFWLLAAIQVVALRAVSAASAR